MSRRLRPLLTVLLAAGLLAAACDDVAGPAAITALPRDLTAAELRVIEGSNTFAIGLLREAAAAAPAEPNVILSPLSASMALGMTMNGAAGETWAQMRDALGFAGLEEPEINGAYRGLIDLLLSLDPRVEMGLGNSIWTREGYPVLEAFYDRARASFDARVQEVDFADPGAPDLINAWVEDVTRGRIREMVTAIPPNVVMYLLNAVYFKGDWTRQFDTRNTATAPFTLPGGGSVQVPLMRQTAPFRSFSSAQARGVELPYGGGAFTAVAILPREPGTLADLVATLEPADWAEWMAALDSNGPTEAAVLLPRLELEYEQVLNGTLQALGMIDAFGDAADFSRMVSGGGVWIDEVKQKTFLKVDEKGTEAAAATSVSMVESAPPEFRFDRPFIFAIRERISGTILFIATIGDPTA